MLRTFGPPPLAAFSTWFVAARWRAAALSSAASGALRAVLTLLALAATLGASRLAAADEGGKPSKTTKIAVYVEGPNATDARDVILQALPPYMDVVDDSAYKEAFKKAGQRGPLGNTMTLEKPRVKMLEKALAASEAVGAKVTLLGRVRRTKAGGQEVWVVLLEDSTEPVLDEPVPFPKREEERVEGFKTTLGKPLAIYEPPKEEPKAAPPPPPPPMPVDEVPPREKHTQAGALVSAALYLELGGRYFDYRDGISVDNLLPYSVFGAPGLLLSVEAYPAAGTGIRVLKDAGLTVGYGRALGLKSAQGEGEPFGTTWQRFMVGLKGRIAIGDDILPPLVYPSGTLVLHSFGFSDVADPIKANVPSVAYTALRLGVDGRYPFLDRFAVTGGIAYHLVLSGGADAEGDAPADVANRFRDTGIGGLDFNLGGAVEITDGLEARLAFEYVRYFYSFAPEAGDAFIAGGATDQLLWIRAGAAYTY